MKNKNNLRVIRLSLIAVIIILIIFGIAIGKRIATTSRQKREISSLEQTVTEISEENSKIQETLDNGEDESYIERVAREEYSYVKPEERIYYDSDS